MMNWNQKLDTIRAAITIVPTLSTGLNVCYVEIVWEKLENTTAGMVDMV
jgi:hypothetical protein